MNGTQHLSKMAKSKFRTFDQSESIPSAIENKKHTFYNKNGLKLFP